LATNAKEGQKKEEVWGVLLSDENLYNNSFNLLGRAGRKRAKHGGVQILSLR
jgi:hypothetical protein